MRLGMLAASIVAVALMAASVPIAILDDLDLAQSLQITGVIAMIIADSLRIRLEIENLVLMSAVIMLCDKDGQQ